MKTFFLNKKFTGLGTVKTVCLLILTAVLLTGSFTAFAAGNCTPGKSQTSNPQKPKGDKNPKGAAAPDATKTAKGAAAPDATKAPNKNTFVQLNTVALVSKTVSEEKALTTAGGLPLYDFDPDTDPTKPVCTKTLMVASNMACTAVWLPLVGSDGTSLTVDGVSCKLTVTQNENGQQVTCNGHLLYTYAKDPVLIATGNNNGGGKWHVATPDLLAAKPAAQSESPAPSTPQPSNTPQPASTPQPTGTPAGAPSKINIK
jgi:predicted lipoprotein with Yx(FWY)xxD motif